MGISLSKYEESLFMYANCHKNEERKWRGSSEIEFRLLPISDEVEPVIVNIAKTEINNKNNIVGAPMLPLKTVRDISKGYISKTGDITCQIRVSTTPIVYE